MPRRKKKRFQAAKAVKALARERLGTPPPTRRAPAQPKPREDKHKPTLGRLLSGDS